MEGATLGTWRARSLTRGGLLLLFGLLVSPLPAAASPPAGLDRGQLFVRLQTERTARFLQEEFDFTLTVYSRGLTMGREIAIVNEDTPGLRFSSFRDQGSGREEIDGEVYEVHRFLGRAQAVAAGSFAIRPTVRASVVIPGGGRGRSTPGDPLSSGAEIRQAELHPPPLTIGVQLLPEQGRPAGFTGAVGSFTLAAAIRPAAVAAGEPVALSLEIRGTGSIGSVAAPAVPAGDRFKVYEPKLLRKELGEDGSGRLMFEQVLVPRTTAATSVPAVSFSYFDPVRRSYRELVRGPFPLAVKPGTQAAVASPEAPAAAPVASRPRIPPAIAPLKPEPGGWLSLPVRFRHASPWFLALQCLPLAVVVALFFAMRRRDELARDVAKARRRLAPRAARPGFEAASQALAEGNVERFHEALWGALCSYFAHRLNLRPGEIGSASVTRGLAATGHDPVEVTRVGEIFDLLEWERFGRPPGAAAGLDAAGRQRLSTLLGEIDRIVETCDKGAS